MPDPQVLIVDPQTGYVKPAAPDVAEQEFVAGRAALAPDQSIPLIAPDGKTVMNATPDKVQAAMQDGWRMATGHETRAYDAQSQRLQSALEGAGRVLTFGLSDLGLRAAGVEGLAERADTGWGKAGEYGGLGLTFLLPGLGEAGLAGRAAAEGSAISKGLVQRSIEAALSPTAAVQRLGAGAEALARKGLSSIVERDALQALGATAVRGAVEGTIYGAGAGISEEALGNPDMNAESLIAAMGGGALMGAGLGAGAGVALHGASMAATGAVRAVGSGIGRAASAAGEKLGELASKTSPKIGELLGRTPDAVPGEVTQLTADQISAQLGQMGYDVPASNSVLKQWMQGAVKFATETVPQKLGRYRPEDIAVVNSPKAQAWIRQRTDTLEDTGRDMVSVINRIAETQQQAGREIYGPSGLRAKALAEKIPTGNEAYILKAVDSTLRDVANQLGEIRINATDYGMTPGQAEAVTSATMQHIAAIEDRIFAKADVPREYTVTRTQSAKRPMLEGFESGRAGEDVATTTTEKRYRTLRELAEYYPIEPGVIHDAYDELNRFKQLLSDPSKFGEDLPTVGRSRLQDRYQQAYFTVRDGLQDEAVWGQAGALQKAWNAAYGVRSDAWQKLQSVFRFRDGKVDPASVGTYLNRVDRLSGDRVVEAMDQWQAANVQYARTAREQFGGKPEVFAEADRLNGEFTTLRKQLQEKVTVFNALRRLTEQYNRTFGTFGTGALTTAVGGTVGALFGLPAGAAAAVGTLLLNPARTAVLRANTAEMLNELRTYIGNRGAGLFAEETTARAKALAEKGTSTARAAISRVGETLGNAYDAATTPRAPSTGTLRRIVSPATIEMLEGKTDADRQAAYRTRMAEIQALSNPALHAEHATRQLGEATEALPAHSAAMITKTQLALGMLAAQFPPVRSGTFPTDPIGQAFAPPPVVGEADLRRFAQIDRVVQDPLSVLDRAHSGVLFQHEVDALNQAYPGLAAQIRQAVLMGLENSGGKKPSTGKRRAINLLLGVKMPGTTAQAQAIFTNVNKGVPPYASSGAGGTAPKVRMPASQTYESTTDRLDNYLTN